MALSDSESVPGAGDVIVRQLHDSYLVESREDGSSRLLCDTLEVALQIAHRAAARMGVDAWFMSADDTVWCVRRYRPTEDAAA